MKACKACGGSLEHRRKGTKFCDVSCRSRYWLKRNPDRDSRNGRKRRGNVSGRRKRAAGTRQATTYRVYLLLDPLGTTLMFQREVLAHDRETAIRAVATGLDGRFVALPARSLRDFNGDGRP